VTADRGASQIPPPNGVRDDANELLARIVGTLPDLYFVTDDAGRIRYFHGGGTHDLYRPPDDFLGRTFAEVLPPPVAGLITQAIARVASTGQPTTIEYPLQVGERDQVFEARIIPLGGGEFAAVVRNVTDRTHVERALRASEERYRRIVETAAEGIITLDTQGLITFANARMGVLLGYQPAELVGRSIFDFLVGRGRDLTAGVLASSQVLGEQGAEVEFIRRDGRPLWVRASGNLVFDDDGVFQGALGMVTDATERKQAESLMAAIVDSSPNMIFVKRADDLRFVAFNRAGERLLGYQREEVLGRRVADVFGPQEAASLEATDRVVLAGGRAVHTPEAAIDTPEHGLRHLRMWHVLIRDASGGPGYILCTAEDVTDRRALDERLRQTQAIEALGRLAAGIAHDFNNVLGIILGFAELLEDDCATDPQAAHNLANVIEAAERARDLVEQIAGFSRTTPRDRAAVDLGDTVASAIKLLRPTMPATVSIDLRIPVGLPCIRSEPSQLFRLVANLVTNSAQAMGARGGELTVALDWKDMTVAEAAGVGRDLAAGRYLRLVVRDTGAGMDRPTLERIFEPYFTTKPPGEGTGLGLWVVHSIVRSHAGAIVARSQLGEGTTIEVYLPADDATMADEPPDLPMVARGNGEHLLLVDDERGLLEAGRGLLEQLGYRVTTFADPAAAAAAFRSQPRAFDLVVTDVTMPGLSGLELARQVRELNETVPLLFHTGFAGRLTPDEIRAVGACGVLPKPSTRQGLAGAVREALARAARPA
jgi:PAS domain S-box-containing protein